MDATRIFFNPANRMLVTTGVTTLLAGSILAGVQPASAATVDFDDSDLQEHFDDIVTEGPGIDADEDYTEYELFVPQAGGILDSHITLEMSGDLADDNKFGIYSKNTGDEAVLFDGAKGVGDRAIFEFANGNLNIFGGSTYTDFGDVFGFFFQSGDNTFYSEASRNSDGQQQSLIYQGDDETKVRMPNGSGGYKDDGWTFGTGDFFVAFEEQLRDGKIDSDFSDLVVFSSDLEPAPVPEPSAMAALGLVGGFLTFTRRRRQ